MTQLPSAEQIEATIRWLEYKSTESVSINGVEVPIQWLLDYVIRTKRLGLLLHKVNVDDQELLKSCLPIEVVCY